MTYTTDTYTHRKRDCIVLCVGFCLSYGIHLTTVLCAVCMCIDQQAATRFVDVKAQTNKDFAIIIYISLFVFFSRSYTKVIKAEKKKKKKKNWCAFRIYVYESGVAERVMKKEQKHNKKTTKNTKTHSSLNDLKTTTAVAADIACVVGFSLLILQKTEIFISIELRFHSVRSFVRLSSFFSLFSFFRF